MGAGIRPGAGGLIAGFLGQIEGIVMGERSKAETKWRAKTKGKELPCFPNGLAEPLSESF